VGNGGRTVTSSLKP